MIGDRFLGRERQLVHSASLLLPRASSFFTFESISIPYNRYAPYKSSSYSVFQSTDRSGGGFQFKRDHGIIIQ